MKTIINPSIENRGRLTGRAYGAFMGYPKRGGQYLHYECYPATETEARTRLAAVIRKARASE